MKWFTITVFIIVAVFFFSCSAEKQIKKVIGDFEDAANENDLDAMEATISSHSDWSITDLQQKILDDHLSGYTPLEYTELDIFDLDKPHAEVESTALYDGIGPTTAWFVMREEEKFFSFLFPDWKIKEFYDLDDRAFPIWKKLQSQNLTE